MSGGVTSREPGSGKPANGGTLPVAEKKADGEGLVRLPRGKGEKLTVSVRRERREGLPNEQNLGAEDCRGERRGSFQQSYSFSKGKRPFLDRASKLGGQYTDDPGL